MLEAVSFGHSAGDRFLDAFQGQKVRRDGKSVSVGFGDEGGELVLCEFVVPDFDRVDFALGELADLCAAFFRVVDYPVLAGVLDRA